MAYSDYMAGAELVLSVLPTAPERIGDDHALPVTPETIATQVGECASMGATVASLYGWTDGGDPTPEALPEVGAAVRQQTPDVLVEYGVPPTCPLGDYLDIVDTHPRPDIARVPLSPRQHGQRGVQRLSRHDVERFLDELGDRHIKPNLLVSGGRDVHELYRLLETDRVSEPVVTLRLGARDGAVATPLSLIALLDALPSAATAVVAATGPNQYPLTTMAMFLGAHVRVGMGDNRYLGFEEPVDRNIQLVQRVAEALYHSERSFADTATTMTELSVDGRRADPSE